jgi:hypothetical protein
MIKSNYIATYIYVLFLLILVFSCSEDENPSSAQPNIQVNVNDLNFGIVEVNEHSESKVVIIHSNDLVSNLSISTSNNFQVSLDDINFSQQLNIARQDANSESLELFIRFTPDNNSLGAIDGSLTVKSSQADDVVINLNGEAVNNNPIIQLNASSFNFGNVNVNQDSNAEVLEVTGANLTSGINILASDQFLVSLDNISFSSNVTILPANANSNNTIYIIFSPNSVESVSGELSFESEGLSNISLILTGNGVPVVHNYQTFDMQPTGFGGGLNQAATSVFTLHSDISNISQIKMYLQINCSTNGCDDWDRFANVKVKDPSTNEWYELGRYITPYWVGTEMLDRGFEFDVTDFKSLLHGSVELRVYVENWTTKADLISVDFDFIEGTPDYPYYSVSEVLDFHENSISGIPYGVSHDLDLDKQITLPSNAESAHLRTIISGWGHASPLDTGGRPCAEWCFRTHDVLINGATTFSHYMGPLVCSQNPLNNQSPGNWTPDRAGWCPGMVVPVRIDSFSTSFAGASFSFEYDLEDWTNDGLNGDAYYATSTYIVVKSNTMIAPPVVLD